ncbi:MAG TPA: histidine kinase, partial [Myxococcota bacterium]|nr:histidine kinase [Myxococcota bacterium]
MRLALKLTLYIWLGILVVLGVNGYTRFLRESKLFETDMAQDHGIMGRGIAGAISTVWEDEGRQRALDVVERVNKKENDITIRFVELERGTEPTTVPAAPPETMQEVARGNIVTWIDRSGEGHLYSYVPIYLDKNLMGAVELSEPLTAQRAYIRNSFLRLGVTTGGMALVAGLISVAIGVLLIGRPVQALALRARRIGSGDFSPGIFVTQSDELGYLGNEIESMALQLAEARDRVEAESRALAEATEQLRRAERVSTVGKLAAGVAHELGTPLNVITWRTKKIWSGKVEGEEARDNARIAFEQCERI